VRLFIKPFEFTKNHLLIITNNIENGYRNLVKEVRIAFAAAACHTQDFGEFVFEQDCHSA